jgi:hypothetical protein
LIPFHRHQEWCIPVVAPQPSGIRIFPGLRLPRETKFSCLQVLRFRFGRHGAALLSRSALHPRDETQPTGETTMQQLAKFLTATGRRLRTLGKVVGHLFRKGKLGLKVAVKIPFFVDIEVNFETDWNRRQ